MTMTDRETPAGAVEALEPISDAPWVVERGTIAWMVTEGPGGAQVGNFICEEDARWTAAARNRHAARSVDVERWQRIETALMTVLALAHSPRVSRAAGHPPCLCAVHEDARDALDTSVTLTVCK